MEPDVPDRKHKERRDNRNLSKNRNKSVVNSDFLSTSTKSLNLFYLYEDLFDFCLVGNIETESRS